MYKNFIILLIVNHSLARGLQTIFLYLLFPKRIIFSLEWKKSYPFASLVYVQLIFLQLNLFHCNVMN